MSWECGVCRASEEEDGVKIRAVCHHCGVPLCSADRLIIDDPAFGGDDAEHCEACAERFHPAAAWRPVLHAGGAR